jgi:3-dehydroquinate synthase
METLTVRLGERSYPILFGTDLVPEIRSKVAELEGAGRRIAVVTDANVAAKQGAALRRMFGKAPLLAVPAGERAKTLAGFGRILDFLAAQKLDRAGAVFAVGGGVVGDVAGFAAASYLRGIDYFQVPTTLLAMVDSSVGGKTGVNLDAGKNLVGAFHQPRGVFVATGLLSTLPAREFSAGMAEVIKCGLLGDRKLFAALERRPLAPGSRELASVIRGCCAVKARVVEADERELAPTDGRALLNLGHTFGHAIEQATGYGSYRHGEAVAIGLVAAARLSRKLGLIPEADVGRIAAVIAGHGLRTSLKSPLRLADLVAAMGRDKKARAGRIRFVVLREIGAATTRTGVDPALVSACFREVGAV